MIKKSMFIISFIILIFFGFTNQSKFEASKNIKVESTNLVENRKFSDTIHSTNITDDIVLAIGVREHKEKIYAALQIVNIAKDMTLFETKDICIGDSTYVYTFKIRLPDNFSRVKDGIMIDLIGFDNEVIQSINLSDYISEDFTIK